MNEAEASESEARIGPDEFELALRAKNGDRAAFEELYRRFERTVHGILLASAPRREVADLMQDVFLAALRSIATIDEPSRVGSWLCSIARNAARDLHKRARESAELGEDWPANSAPLERDDEAELALAALCSLPEAYREPLILRLVEGLSGPEIAERTGLTHGSVRVNLTRGMKLLRERLERRNAK